MRIDSTISLRSLGAALSLSLSCCDAHAYFGTVPDYDFQWATIIDVNNPAYGGGPLGELSGRGSVPYEYRISRLELTSAQFLEFVNTFWESAQIHCLTGSSARQAFCSICRVHTSFATTCRVRA